MIQCHYRILSHGLSKLKTQVGEARMIVWSDALRPSKFALRFKNWNVVGARLTAIHSAIVAKLPKLISVGTKPVSLGIMPLIYKPNRHSIFTKPPQLFDQPIFVLLLPLAGQKFDDCRTSGQEIGPIPPLASRRLGKGYFFGVATVPGILRHSNLPNCVFHIEWRQWGTSRF